MQYLCTYVGIITHLKHGVAVEMVKMLTFSAGHLPQETLWRRVEHGKMAAHQLKQQGPICAIEHKTT